MAEADEQHSESGRVAAHPWRLAEQEPTNLIALWPDDQPPTKTEIVTALSEYFGRKITMLEELAEDDPEVAWCFAAKLPTLAAPVVFWSEPAQPLPSEEAAQPGAQQCKWLVGIETLLTAEDPLTDYSNLMRALAGALTDVLAVLDVNTALWHPRRELDEVFASDEVEPPADVLWVVQAVQAARDSGDEGRLVWLHTHGLWRCNAPELEMLEVPLDYAEPAAELINDIAALLLEQSPPRPGEPFEIGPDLQVMLHPAHIVAPLLTRDTPGSMNDRSEENGANPHGGIRAVICAVSPPENPGKIWAWPREVTRRWMADEAAIYMTTRATERQAALARAVWGQFATAFASIARHPCEAGDESGVVFGVKAGFAENDSNEHLWFEVCRFEADRVEGRLVNQPLAVKRLSKGDRAWITRGQISDWRVVTQDGCYGPNDLASLWRAIDALKRDPER